MDRIVVGFDGSSPAAAALRWAASEGRLRQAQLVVRTIDDGSGDLPAEPDPLLAGGYPLSIERETGDIARGLRSGCGPKDLLVLGTRARPAVTELVLGSISRECLTNPPCPVVVIRTADQLRNARGWVIAAVRSSKTARYALHTAATEAHLRAGPLIALHARQLNNVDPELFPAAATRLLEQGREWLTAQLHNADVHAVPEVVLGVDDQAPAVPGQPFGAGRNRADPPQHSRNASRPRRSRGVDAVG